MGKRASLFSCHDCQHDWWEWFEHLNRDELISFAQELECPKCGSSDWKLTDASEFAGSRVYGDAGYPKALTGVDTLRELKQLLGVDELEARISELEGDGDGS